MKLSFKFFILQIMIFAFCVFGASSVIAQDLTKECETIYESIPIKDKNITINDYKKYVVIAKEYLEKCRNVKGQEETRDYLIKQLPKLETTIRDMELYSRFNAAVPNKNWDDAFDSGRQLIGYYPDTSLDILLILASIGFDNAAANPPNDKYNEDAINYAKLALQKMESGVTSENYGAFTYTYKTSECPNGKANAKGWMNYTIGYIIYARQGQKKEALSYIYQSTQIGCETKKLTEPYRLIGDWYYDEISNLEKSRLEKIKVAGNQETDETKSILALQKGYAERSLDAYSRIFKIYSSVISENLTYKFNLRKKVVELYKVFIDADITGLDPYLKDLANTPFIDPATPVIPKPKSQPIN